MSKLKNYVTYEKGYAFKQSHYSSVGIPIIRVSDFTDNSIDLSKTYRLSEKNKKDIKCVELFIDDVLIATVGSWANNPASIVGKVVRVPKTAQNTLLNQNAVRLRCINKEEQIFLFYLLKDKKFSNYIISTAQGSANQASITLKDILDYELPKLTQRQKIKIGNFLDIFDNKIQLNTETNQTLEAIAQAIFKHWFIDFAPVHAKAGALAESKTAEQAELAAMASISGKTEAEITALAQTNPQAYKELQQTASAFPSEFVESELGLVPKGWFLGSIGDITKSRKEKVKDSIVKVLSATSNGELVLSENYFTRQVYSKSVEKYLKVYPNDFAFNPSRINIGSIGLHKGKFLGAVSPAYEVFSVKSSYKWYLERFFKLENTAIKINALCNGSVRQSLKIKDLQSIKIIIPEEKTIENFNILWKKIDNKNNQNIQENITLVQTRDTLLPKLLNGEVEL